MKSFGKSYVPLLASVCWSYRHRSRQFCFNRVDLIWHLLSFPKKQNWIIKFKCLRNIQCVHSLDQMWLAGRGSMNPSLCAEPVPFTHRSKFRVSFCRSQADNGYFCNIPKGRFNFFVQHAILYLVNF